MINGNLSAVTKDTEERTRKNILKKPEQKLICFLVVRIPLYISSNILTLIGFLGYVITAASLVLARHHNHSGFIFIGILGIFINWFGDSLDGRLAYFRGKPRKWFGFTLDFITDWFGIIVIGAGFIVYLSDNNLYGFFLVTFYAWAMMQALIKYRLTNQYVIDAGGMFGPTEMRIVLCIFLCLEYFWHGIIVSCSIFGICALFIINMINFVQLLKEAHKKDQHELSTRL